MTRLQDARSDASYLLLQRVLTLATALPQPLQRDNTAAAAGDVDVSGPAPTLSTVHPGVSRNPLHDAAVVAVGLAAGQAIWDGVSADTDVDTGLDGLLN